MHRLQGSRIVCLATTILPHKSASRQAGKRFLVTAELCPVSLLASNRVPSANWPKLGQYLRTHAATPPTGPARRRTRDR